ncbi:MAG TPA: hypothetical protein VFL96_06480, partial [Acidobacteriaceae bacterium]|nr:hypothetical protein [Acidobacteriaceae bacterium]
AAAVVALAEDPLGVSPAEQAPAINAIARREGNSLDMRNPEAACVRGAEMLARTIAVAVVRCSDFGDTALKAGICRGMP